MASALIRLAFKRAEVAWRVVASRGLQHYLCSPAPRCCCVGAHRAVGLLAEQFEIRNFVSKTDLALPIRSHVAWLRVKIPRKNAKFHRSGSTAECRSGFRLGLSVRSPLIRLSVCSFLDAVARSAHSTRHGTDELVELSLLLHTASMAAARTAGSGWAHPHTREAEKAHR